MLSFHYSTPPHTTPLSPHYIKSKDPCASQCFERYHPMLPIHIPACLSPSDLPDISPTQLAAGTLIHLYSGLCHLFCLPVTDACVGVFRYPPFLMPLDPSLELTDMSSKAVRGEMTSCCSCCCNDLLAMMSLSNPEPTDDVTDTNEWESSSSYLLPRVK